MRKKVVQGGPVFFKDDLPMDSAAIAAPLALPPMALVEDRLTLHFKRRFFVLDRRPPANHFAKVWGQTYALVERGSPGATEAAYFRDHRAEIAATQREWLRAVLGGAEPASARATFGPQIVDVLTERIDAAYARPAGVPAKEAGAGGVLPSAEPSLYAELEGLERVLFLDGKVYDLLTIPEYLSKFEQAIDPETFRELVAGSAGRTPAEVVRLLDERPEAMKRRTLGVLRGKIHFDDRTFELFLDGVYFIPEYRDKASVVFEKHRLLLERQVKRDAAKGLTA